MRRHRLALAALPCALLLLSMPLSAQQVYKWKDANGVTQYSTVPPPDSNRYETRKVDERQAPEPRAGDAPAEDPACATARGNLVLLKGLERIGPDNDGDGKPDRAFTDAERTDRIALVEATIRVKCAIAPPAPDPQEEPEEE
jgi:hypothetical protein